MTTAESIRKASLPEDVFGVNESELTSVFRKLAKVYHPDVGGDNETFRCLNKLYELAQIRVKNKTYGNRNIINPVTLIFKKDKYTFNRIVGGGDKTSVYGNDIGQVVKITRDVKNNDLTLNEIKVLKAFETSTLTKDKQVNAHVPKLINSGMIKEGKINRQTVILEELKGFYSLEEVRSYYPKGLHLGDAAWMFNRVLGALLLAHTNGYVHGAVLPCHILIRPEDHNGVLIDWGYAGQHGVDKLKAIVPKYKDFYPPEVFAKQPLTFGSDIYMIGATMIWLLGGDVKTKTVPFYSKRLTGLMRSCFLNKYRPDDVFGLYEDFKEVLLECFGKPKFRNFVFPPTSVSK